MAKLFERDGELGLTVPAELSARYHLAPDVEVEVIATDDGILLKPIGVAPWFSLAWEDALDFVVQEYGQALVMVAEEPETPADAETSAGTETPAHDE
jgi:hypothetical protein